jgi:hypothetical protein
MLAKALNFFKKTMITLTKLLWFFCFKMTPPQKFIKEQGVRLKKDSVF